MWSILQHYTGATILRTIPQLDQKLLAVVNFKIYSALAHVLLLIKALCVIRLAWMWNTVLLRSYYKAVMCWMNTIQYSPEAVRYMQQVFPGPTRVVDANGIPIASAVFAGLTRWQTDWQTDRPRYSVGNNNNNWWSAQWGSQIRFCFCLRLQQVFIGAVDSTDRINFSVSSYSAVRLDRLQCVWRHTTI